MLLQAVNFAYTYMNKTFLRGGTYGNDSPLWGEKVKNSPSPAQQQQQQHWHLANVGSILLKGQ